MNENDPKCTGAIPRNSGYMSQSQQFLPSNYWDIVDKINSGVRVCVILRGLPGSGKSYLGKKLIDDTIGQNAAEHIISADDYFMKNGRYEYDRSKLTEAHQNAQRLFFNRASKGYSPLIIDNTNMQCWEMFPYIQSAIQYSYHLQILEPCTPWKWSAGKLAQKNRHNVAMERIKIMIDNYDKITNVEDIAKNLLKLDIVKEPKIRDIPPYQPKNSALNDSDLSGLLLLDVNRNPQNEPLSWQKFNSDFQKQSSYFSWDTQKKNQEQTLLNNWNPPPQIFEDKWDQPNEKEITIKEKDSNESKQDENKPQPQRKQRKNKKPSSPTNEEAAAIKPHRKNCHNESPDFAGLRQIYPNFNVRSLWDYFEKCNFDVEWCADMLIDENLPEQMDFGQDLTCNCTNNNNNNDNADNEATRKNKEMPSTSGINNNNNNNGNNNKKQTPVRAKKAKSNAEELLAAKMAIEENVKIGEQFYPEHVNKVRGWKKISQPAGHIDFESVLLEQNPNSSPSQQEDETLVALTIDESMIKELDEIFGEGQSFMKEILEQPNLFNKTRMFIKSSTAKQLYREILETFHGYNEEAKLKEIENDRYIAMMLHEQEKATKYPQLTRESNGDFKNIMETQAALKEYQNEHEWQKVEKTETIAEKLSKEKIYKAFPEIDKVFVEEIFEAQNKNFKRTIHIILDSLGYTKDQRKQVFKEIESTEKFKKEDKKDDEEEDDFGPEEYACIKKVEELQEEIDRHSEEIMRCIQKSKDHIAKKEFHTASYYTSVVNLHKQLHEEKRQQLVNMLAFSFLNNASSSRLDLHYFTQEEGKARLHTFLDAHIAKLREIKKQFVDLEIVTGRGAHSSGKPVIKTMTIKLFQERGLRYAEINPGLLKVKVFPNSVLYEEKQRMMKSES